MASNIDDRGVEYFEVVAANADGSLVDLSTELNIGESVELITRTIQNNAVFAYVHALPNENHAQGQLFVAVDPPGTWTAASLQTALRALGSSVGRNSVDLSGTTVSPCEL